MQYQQKHELLELLYEFRRTIPPLAERGILTNHYKKVEKRIEEAIKGLQDADYRYMKAAMDKFTSLQLKKQISFEELGRFMYGTESFPYTKEEEG